MQRSSALRGIGASLLLPAVSGCGVGRAVVRAAERAHGCVDVPVPDARGVRVMRGSFASRHVVTPVDYAIVVPDGARLPGAVAYLLPGRSSTAESALALGVDGFLADYLRGGGAPFALAIVDAGESYFHARAGSEDRGAMVTDEFPRVVENALGRRIEREAVLGHSMGGYGALLAMEEHPRRFRAAAVAGPAIFPSYEDEHRSVGDAFDSAADYARHDVIAHAVALRGRPVFIAIGRRDPFLPGVRLFARACPSAVLEVAAGCHDAGFWRTATPTMLRFAGRALASPT